MQIFSNWFCMVLKTKTKVFYPKKYCWDSNIWLQNLNLGEILGTQLKSEWNLSIDARDFHRFCWNYFSSSLKIKKGKAKAKFCCNFSASKKVFELAEYEDSVVPPTSVKLVASACQKSAGPIQWSKHCQALIKLSILYLFILWGGPKCCYFCIQLSWFGLSSFVNSSQGLETRGHK